jgi:hypothetical protein
MSTVLVDFNNIAMMKLFNPDVDAKTSEPNMELWKFLVFEDIVNFIKKFNHITEVVIAMDSSDVWRKEVFSRYKEKRKDQKDKEVDWNLFYNTMNEFFSAMKNNTPFKCLAVEHCEADDVIGHLALTLDKKIIIYSSDQDYKQVLNKNVRLFSPYHNDWITCDDPEKYLLENILKGQAKDGILNVITPIDWPVDARKPGFGDKKINDWKELGLELMLNKPILYNKDGYRGKVIPKERYSLNEILMDFKKIPEKIQKSIENSYTSYKQSEILNLYPWIEKNGWRGFIDEFDSLEKIMIKLF